MRSSYQDQFYYLNAFTRDLCDRTSRYIKRYPNLITEVLPSSTQAFGVSEKFNDYQHIESLEECVLISQESQRVECRRLRIANTWEATIYKAGDRVVLKSIDLEFAISEFYRDLDGL